MKHSSILITVILLITSCAKKIPITPEGEKLAESQYLPKAETIQISKIEFSESESVFHSVDYEYNSDKNVYSSVIESEKEPEKLTVTTESVITEFNNNAEDELSDREEIQTESLQKKITPKFDPEILFPDSIWTEYLTHPGDYLSLIAYHEYNNPNEWRRIWQWNRPYWKERNIGPNPDNPNFIYPYRELDLKKPANETMEWEYDFDIHIVTSGESLWTIAKDSYEDEYAWVILFWDNESLINENNGKLYPGMELKIRSNLWPDVN